MKNPEDQPQPENRPEIKPLGQDELDALFKLTQESDEPVSEEHRLNIIQRIFYAVDIDKDRLLNLTQDQLDFIFNQLGIARTVDTMPDFYTRLANTAKLNDLLGRIERNEI